MFCHQGLTNIPDFLLQESLEELNRKKKQLREAQEKLKSVHDDLQQKKQKKAELENEVDLCR